MKRRLLLLFLPYCAVGFLQRFGDVKIRHHTSCAPRIGLEAVTLNHDEISRYSRHLVLGDVGMKGQLALKEASVLVVGAGGLGSPCLLYLAAAGMGQVGIVDADTVDESNLQRQIIHGTSTVGVSKCESAAQRIQDINPNVQVRLYEEEFTTSSALRILGEGFSTDRPYDVVIDGSDNFPTKYLIKYVEKKRVGLCVLRPFNPHIYLSKRRLCDSGCPMGVLCYPRLRRSGFCLQSEWRTRLSRLAPYPSSSGRCSIMC